MIQSKLIEKFSKDVHRWSELTSTEQDNIVSYSLETFSRKLAEGEQFDRPLNFLLKTAHNFKKKAIDRREALRVKDQEYRALFAPDRHHGSDAFRSPISLTDGVEASQAHLDLDSSPTWSDLAPQHKKLFQLVVVEELPVATAARMIGVSRSTAKSWLQRDKQKLSCDEWLRQLAKVGQRNPMESLQCQ